jgi:succinate dehydrogenase / fumarate reductase, membrane anchor subunit
MMYSARSRPKSGNFELWAWLFMRVSGIALLFLVLIHFAIMHVFTPVSDLTFNFVAGRFSTPFWRNYDLLLLGLALLHGMNGMRVVADDYIHSRGWRLVTSSTLWAITIFFMVIGAQILLTFQPPAGTR